MEVKYNIMYSIEDDEFDFIELKLSSNSLNKEEIQVLKENGIEHKYLENNEIILIIKSFYSYFVEIDGEDRGIFFEKTEHYFKYLKDISSLRTEAEVNKISNLVISKEGVRVEIEVWIWN